MSALDDAARELAEAVRERYLQPNETLVIPHWMRRSDRRMWDALGAYEKARAGRADDDESVYGPVVMTYQLEVHTDQGRGIYDTVQVRRNQRVPDPERQARALIGLRVRDTPLGRTENQLPTGARVQAVQVHTWIGPFDNEESLILRSWAVRTAKSARPAPLTDI